MSRIVTRSSSRHLGKGEERRAALLYALESQLQERPLTEVSIATVTRSAGLGRSAFYFYFPNKHAAVGALLIGLYDELRVLSVDLIEGRGSPRQALAEAISYTVAAWQQHPHLICAMLDAMATDAQVQQVWDAWMQRFEDLLVEVAAAQEWPLVLPPGVDLRETIAALIGLSQVVLARVTRTAADDHAQAHDRATAVIAHAWTTTLLGSACAEHEDLTI